MPTSSREAGDLEQTLVRWQKPGHRDARAMGRGPRKMLREHIKRPSPGLGASWRRQWPQEAWGPGGQLELRPWLALAIGTPGSWPTGEGAALVRGSPQTPL